MWNHQCLRIRVLGVAYDRSYILKKVQESNCVFWVGCWQKYGQFCGWYLFFFFFVNLDGERKSEASLKLMTKRQTVMINRKEFEYFCGLGSVFVFVSFIQLLLVFIYVLCE